jgi:SAM-dependent methyltransferase
VLTAEVLEELAGSGPLRVLDLGCGNAQMLELFRERGMDCDYTDVDFSDTLLAAARERHAEEGQAALVVACVAALDGVEQGHDIALYSQMMGMLACPDGSPRRARDLARWTVIPFFEPIDHDLHVVELREMGIGDGTTVPCLRRKIVGDGYRVMLARLGCETVDVYGEQGSTNQINVLHYA